VKDEVQKWTGERLKGKIEPGWERTEEREKIRKLDELDDWYHGQTEGGKKRSRGIHA